MAVCWYFYRFDYARYLMLERSLQVATTPEALADLLEDVAAESIAEDLAMRAISLSEARQLLIQTACCLGEPLPFDRGFPRFIATLGQGKGAEDVAELLSDLLGGRNLDSWLAPPASLLGFLTTAETAALHAGYSDLSRRGRLRLGRRRGRRRRGGVWGATVAFMRRLFDLGPLPEDIWRLLGNLLAEAVEQEQGIAVVAA